MKERNQLALSVCFEAEGAQPLQRQKLQTGSPAELGTALAAEIKERIV